MLRELKEIEGSEEALYLRFSKLPVAKTDSYAQGEVNVDLDAYNEVVGIEMLSLDPEEIAVLGEVAIRHHLNFDSLKHACRG